MTNTDNQSKTNALKRVIYSMDVYLAAFEYSEFNHLNKIIDGSSYPEDSEIRRRTRVVVNNFLVESLLLHIRNVMDFFYRGVSTKDKKSDILVTDFTGEGREVFDKNSVLNKVREKINKHLSHLTEEDIYIDGDRRVWINVVNDVNKYLFPKCLAFLEHSSLNKYQMDSQYEATKKELINYFKEECNNPTSNINTLDNIFTEDDIEVV